MEFRRHEDYTREIEKLRGELQALENETRQLYETRIKLQQSQKQNEKLATTLQEAKTQIEALRAEIEKLTAPPSSYALFCSVNDDRTVNVYASGRKMKVSMQKSIPIESLRKGQEVILNEALNIIEVGGFDPQGQVVRLKDRLDDVRVLVQLHHCLLYTSPSPRD